MKTMIAATVLAVVSLTAWAVSLEFPQYTAIEIGEVEVTKTEENTETTVEFSGPGLLPIFNGLPEVFDIETGKNSETLRGLDIFNTGKGAPTKKINFQCVKEGNPATAKCRITITKGMIAG